MKTVLTESQLDHERFRFQDYLDYILTNEEWTAICGFFRIWARRHKRDEHNAHMAFSVAIQELIRLTIERNGKMYPHLDSHGEKLPMPDYWPQMYRKKMPR